MSYIGSTPTTQSFIAGTDSFNGTGSATNFTLSRFVNSTNDIQVVVNNVVQYPPNYSVSGNTLTISPAPSAGTNNVYVRYLSTTLQSIAPSQGSSIQFGIGSAALPSISFIGDPNTGIYSPTADTIAFVEGGVEAMRIDSSANVGIGTTTINYRLVADCGGVANNNNGVAVRNTQSDGYGGSYNFEHRITSGGSVVNASFISSEGGGNGSFIRFATTGSGTLAERARIDSSGNLLVGTTSGDARFHVAADSSVIDVMRWNDTRTGSATANMVIIRRNNATVGSIQTTNVATSYNTSSDYRLKENVQPMTGALAKIAALNPCTYNWKIDGSEGEGFIAHELAEVVPQAVAGEKDAVNEDGSIKPQGIDTSFLVATLTAAIQEQQAMIDTMKQEIAELKAKVGE